MNCFDYRLTDPHATVSLWRESLSAVCYSPSIVTGAILYHLRDKATYW